MKKITDIKLILIILGVLGLFILLSLVLKIDQSRRGLASLKAELIAQGERLEWSQLVSNPPADVSNGWEVLLGTASAVPDLPRGEAPLTIYCSPGIRVPSHRIDTLPTELRWSKGRRTWTRNVWAELEASIDGTRHLRDSLRDAIAHDVIFADLDWSRGYSLTLPNLTIIRRLAQWNSLIVALDLRSGDLKAAMQAQTEAFG